MIDDDFSCRPMDIDTARIEVDTHDVCFPCTRPISSENVVQSLNIPNIWRQKCFYEHFTSHFSLKTD